jgi:hypothetical protein
VGALRGVVRLLMLELHALPPELAAAHLRQTPVVAYDGTHGFSDQYLVELPIFLECARGAGLQADDRHNAKFSALQLATVSVNFVTALAGASGPSAAPRTPQACSVCQLTLGTCLERRFQSAPRRDKWSEPSNRRTSLGTALGKGIDAEEEATFFSVATGGRRAPQNRRG